MAPYTDTVVIILEGNMTRYIKFFEGMFHYFASSVNIRKTKYLEAKMT